MKISKTNLAIALVSILILVAASTILILEYALESFRFMTHPVLNFLLVISAGFGVMTAILGIFKKTPWYFFLSSIIFSYLIIYGFCQFKQIWFVGLIIAIVACAISAIFSFVVAGNKTEDIALNDKPEYKDYKQRKAEKEFAESQEEKKELSKIKSFKD